MKWMNVWSYSQIDYRSAPSRIGNCMQGIRIKSNNSAEKVKVRFSNLYGIEPIFLKSASFLMAERVYPLTLDGNSDFCIKPGAENNSDEIEVRISSGDWFEIRLFMEKETMLTSGTVTYSQSEMEIIHTYADSGAAVPSREVFSMVKENNRRCFAFGVSGIDFYTIEQERYMVAFGDSLTQQGFWTDPLKKRLRESGKGNIAVLNRGIGGSRILTGTSPLADPYNRHGISGILRFEQDCFAFGRPDFILVLHGINDLITKYEEKTDAAVALTDMIGGLRQYAEIAHRYGTKIWLGTLAPLKHSMYYRDELEKERIELNEWICTQKDYDGILPFERAVRSKQDPAALDESCDSGDGLHFSKEGGRAAADSIPIEELIGGSEYGD